MEQSRYFPTAPIPVDTTSLTIGHQWQSQNSLSLVTLPMGDKGPGLPRLPTSGFGPSRITGTLQAVNAQSQQIALAHTLSHYLFRLFCLFLLLSSPLLSSPCSTTIGIAPCLSCALDRLVSCRLPLSLLISHTLSLFPTMPPKKANSGVRRTGSKGESSCSQSLTPDP